MFALIRDALGSEDYHCLHSVGLTKHHRKEYAEADFVLVGPAGVFSIEAKGGLVDRTDGVWTIGWPGNSYTSSEGPFAQSEKTTHPLKRWLKDEVGLGPDQFLMGWGVAFPHVLFTTRSPEWDPEVVYDERDTSASFMRYVERLERHFAQRRAVLNRPTPPRLDGQTARRIVGSLRGDFELIPTIRSLLGDSRRELAALSPSQFAVLDLALHARNPRLICDGAAGTGKTLIGMEAARRLAIEGKKVLFLCFNTQLSRFLSNDAIQAGDRITISTVHKFLTGIIRKAGFENQLRSTRSDDPDYFSRLMPDLFERAIFALLEEDDFSQFDAIVIDEAQDVLNLAVMNVLDLVIRGGFRDGRWLLLLDTGLQAQVYANMEHSVLSALRGYANAECVLRENFRNPKAIVREMAEVIQIDVPDCRRTIQSSVDYRTFENEKEAARKLRALLVELIRDGADPGTITVLSAKAKVHALATRHPPDIGKKIFYLEDGGSCPPDAISCSSISAFKGLENEIIILTDLPSTESLPDWARSVVYVGMTRARSKLFMIVDEAFIDVRSRV